MSRDRTKAALFAEKIILELEGAESLSEPNFVIAKGVCVDLDRMTARKDESNLVSDQVDNN